MLQSVSKLLYDKDIDKSELPSTATANNFVDIAQILGKYQLAEELVESDSWDLHGDGKGESGCSGAPFRDNIKMCIMQLVGELDIPTTKVSQVLQSVSKWLYDKDIDQSELPSTATANNFVDIAQVLGKYQLAEEIIESDRWDLLKAFTQCDRMIQTGDSGRLFTLDIASSSWSAKLSNIPTISHSDMNSVTHRIKNPYNIRS